MSKKITETDVRNTSGGGALAGTTRDGQTIIHKDGTLGGYLVGKMHSEGGIKAEVKGGQQIEMQGNEVVITAPAVEDKTKREFQGQMLTNRQILSKINEEGGGVSFADGGDVPTIIKTTGKKYTYGGKLMPDHDIVSGCGCQHGMADGGTVMQEFGKGGTFGGNSGYVGYSMSKRAAEAYEDGKLTYSKLPTWAKRMVDAGLVTTNEWHHTSSYGNETPFYNVQQFDTLTDAQKKELNIDDWENIETFKDVPKAVVKLFDGISKKSLKNKNNIKDIRKLYVQQAQKELNDFNAHFQKFLRKKESPTHSIIELSEMDGKYGWFEATSRYNLPIYYSGIDYETHENKLKAIELQHALHNASYKPLYEIELSKIGFTEQEIKILKDSGIITSEIMPQNFYNLIEKNIGLIKHQLKELSELPTPTAIFSPHFSKTSDSFLTDAEKQTRQDYHNFISEQGENFGSSYERRLAHESNDAKYYRIANERFNVEKEAFLNSDKLKAQEIKFDEDKKIAKIILDNIKLLFDETYKVDEDKTTAGTIEEPAVRVVESKSHLDILNLDSKDINTEQYVQNNYAIGGRILRSTPLLLAGYKTLEDLHSNSNPKFLTFTYDLGTKQNKPGWTTFKAKAYTLDSLEQIYEVENVLDEQGFFDDTFQVPVYMDNLKSIHYVPNHTDADYVEYKEFLEKRDKQLQDNFSTGNYAGGGNISDTTMGELDKAQRELKQGLELQDKMKKANTIIKAGKDVTNRLMAIGFSQANAEKLQTKDFAGRIGFASYKLTNNNANNKRLQDRVNLLQQKVSASEKAAATGEAEKYEFDTAPGGYIEINYPEDRVQIFFNEKTSRNQNSEMYEKLKRGGWNFSYRNECWQRKITPQAISAAVYMTKATKVKGTAVIDAPAVEKPAETPVLNTAPSAPSLTSVGPVKLTDFLKVKEERRFKNMGDYIIHIETTTGKKLLDFTEDQIIEMLNRLPGEQLVGSGSKKNRVQKAAQMMIYHAAKNVPDNQLTLEQFAIKKFIGGAYTEAAFYSEPLVVFTESFRKEWEKAKEQVPEKVMIPTYMVDDIKNSIALGYNEIKEGMISPNKRGLALVNKNSQVMGTYPIEIKSAIQQIIDEESGKTMNSPAEILNPEERNAIKEEGGNEADFISTRRFFIKPYQEKDLPNIGEGIGAAFISDESNGKLENLLISDLIPTQLVVAKSTIENKTGKQKKVTILKNGKDLFVMDGHHSIADAVNEGQKKIEAIVYDITDIDVPKYKSLSSDAVTKPDGTRTFIYGRDFNVPANYGALLMLELIKKGFKVKIHQDSIDIEKNGNSINVNDNGGEFNLGETKNTRIHISNIPYDITGGPVKPTKLANDIATDFDNYYFMDKETTLKLPTYSEIIDDIHPLDMSVRFVDNDGKERLMRKFQFSKAMLPNIRSVIDLGVKEQMMDTSYGMEVVLSFLPSMEGEIEKAYRALTGIKTTIPYEEKPDKVEPKPAENKPYEQKSNNGEPKSAENEIDSDYDPDHGRQLMFIWGENEDSLKKKFDFVKAEVNGDNGELYLVFSNGHGTIDFMRNADIHDYNETVLPQLQEIKNYLLNMAKNYVYELTPHQQKALFKLSLEPNSYVLLPKEYFDKHLKELEGKSLLYETASPEKFPNTEVRLTDNGKKFIKNYEFDVDNQFTGILAVPVVKTEAVITGMKFFKGIDNQYKNPYELNKAIEEFIDMVATPNSITPAQKQFLSYYSGYGGLEKFGASGKGLLYEYFTPSEICKRMWGLAYKFGYKGGRFLEPAVGVGEFFKYAPNAKLGTAFEINEYSYKIFKLLYPEATITLASFETLFIKNNKTIRDSIDALPKFDLVIGNPPYGEYNGFYSAMGEKKYTKAENWIDYFIFRSLDLLKKDGLLIFIIGTEVANGGTPWLQKEMTKAKELIAVKADLVDAYRLPNGVFERTDVLSDIIVLRKK